MGIIIVIWRKISLIYRKNSYIFSPPLRTLLCAFRVEIIGRSKNFAVLPTLEEGLLHKNKLKLVLNYLT